MSKRVLVTVFVLTAAVAAASQAVGSQGGTARGSAAAATPAWPSYHHDPAHSGVGPPAPSLVPPQQAWTAHLDGDVYGEPLVADGLVVVATENDTVYGLAAGDGSVAWSEHLGTPVSLSTLPCGDIDPLGITSTPVIDPATNRLFVLAEEQTAGGVQHELVGLDAASGAIAFRRVIDPAGMDPRVQQQRAALALSAGLVQVAFGGLDGDCGDYHGWVLSVAEDGTGAVHAFRTAGSQVGIWASGGPVVDGSGNVYVATGNGSSTTTYDQGNSVLKLSPTGAVLDSFAEPNWAANNAGDVDLGSAGPILLSGGLLFEMGKDGEGYLLDSNHLGGVGGQRFSQHVCRSFGAQAWSAPMLYVECIDGHLEALRVDTGNPPSYAIAWTSSASGEGPPVVGGGAVWTEAWDAGTLSGVDPATGHVLVQVDTGPAAHFTTPTVAAGLLLVAAGPDVHAFFGSPPSTQGYWLAGADGNVYANGTAPALGSLNGTKLAAPIVGMAATPGGHGYWLVASDGGIFNFGDATFHGSTGNIHLNQPIVAIAASASGNGYLLAAADGGIFNFGDATFHGSTGNIHLNQPIVAIAASPSGNGYLLAAADGGIFNFGDSEYAGSAAGSASAPVVAAAGA